MNESMWVTKDWIPVLAAFVGACFAGIGAFLVSQMSAKITRHREHWRKHRNALVQLEYRLNEILCIVWDNRYLVQRIQEVMAKHDGRVPVTWMEPQPLPSVASEYPKLLRLELVNGFFSFQVKLRRHNDDIAQICSAHADMRSAKIRANIDRSQYVTSLGEYINNVGELQKAYDLIDKYTMELLARVRVSIRKDRLLDKAHFFTVPSCLPVTPDDVSMEIPIVEKGIEQVRAKSRQDIKEFFGDPPEGE